MVKTVSTSFFNSSSDFFLNSWKPENNSSRVIFPSPFLSILLNNLIASWAWFNCVLLWTKYAITAHLRILSLLYLVKLFNNFERFFGFIALLFSICLTPFVLNHLCFKASSAVILLFGFNCNKSFIKSLASWEMIPQGYFVISYTPNFIFFIISSSVCPLKGGLPVNKIYIIIPQLQISHFSV